jgi:acyl-CoA reductase-like NAD-dependent aldehyde dehydrogenase
VKVFVHVVKQIKVGKDSKAFYGSLISKVQFDKVLSYIEAGKSEAKLECGGGQD